MVSGWERGKRRRTRQVVIVGAGAAGVGLAVALKQAGIDDVLLLDRHGVGGSFMRWPREMRFLTPSFPSHSVGVLDLNAIALGTSPAHFLKVEHPTGKEYAAYLQAVADHFRLEVRAGVLVKGIEPEDGLFRVLTDDGGHGATHVVWAGGEFNYPNVKAFLGAALCLHNARVGSWKHVAGDQVYVIGGYESGLDAAIHLARLGKQVMVLDRGEPWKEESSDPSISPSTYTLERLRAADVAPRVQLASGAEVVAVRKTDRGYVIDTASGRTFRTVHRPVLATGFTAQAALVPQLFAPREDGFPLLTENDESTITPGLFLAGPLVRHDHHVFCFIFKFRQRLAVVARAIAKRLGRDTTEFEANFRSSGMLLDDLSCCGAECVC
jgi:cation diffusion facilitator CzcD-associated flavoprotein CzcO